MSALTQPTYGGGTIVTRPTQGGRISSECFTIIEPATLVTELGAFVITEASEKIRVGQTVTDGCLSAAIAQRPRQGGTITQGT